MSAMPVGKHLGPKERRAYAAAIRAELVANPEVTLDALMAKTGASRNLATDIRKRWRAERMEAA